MATGIGMCTYRRPDLVVGAVEAALAQLDTVDAPGRVIVVDNDAEGSGLAALQGVQDPRLSVVVEPTPGISAARNRVLAEAADLDRMAFIDDDELPTPGWLATLDATMTRHHAAAVAGPVRSSFTEDADPWVVQGGFFDRTHRAGLTTGTSIPEAATNNLLLDMHQVRARGLQFRTELGLTGGEDSAFTRSLTREHAGQPAGVMVWCAEAEVTEVVPPQRATRSWVLRRAASMGNSRALRELEESTSTSTRLRLVGGGAARTLAGGGRAGLGLARRNVRDQGRGLRTALTGVGMLLGATGWSYREYARDGRRVTRAR